MSLTRTEARDAINALIKEAIDTIDNLKDNIIWDDVEADPPGGTMPPLPYVKVFIRHQLGTQGSLSNRLGNRIFNRAGIITIQIFTPSGSGLTNNDNYASIIANAMEGVSSPNGVWFRNVRIQEIGNNGGGSFLTNVIAEFEYIEIK